MRANAMTPITQVATLPSLKRKGLHQHCKQQLHQNASGGASPTPQASRGKHPRHLGWVVSCAENGGKQMFDNTGIGNSGFRELDTSELALIAGGHFGEELTDEYINFQIALQSLSILQKAALLDGMADAGMLPSPMSGGEGSEIIVTGDSGSNDPNLFTGSLLEGAFEILLDLMRDANEQDREILLGLLESGEIDTFLNTVDDGAAQPIDTASIDIEVNIDRPLTEGEQEAIEKLEAFIAAVTTALNMLPDNAQITLENGQVVTAGELKQAWASTDFRIDDTNTQYANQS